MKAITLGTEECVLDSAGNAVSGGQPGALGDLDV